MTIYPKNQSIRRGYYILGSIQVYCKYNVLTKEVAFRLREKTLKGGESDERF